MTGLFKAAENEFKLLLKPAYSFKNALKGDCLLNLKLLLVCAFTVELIWLTEASVMTLAVANGFYREFCVANLIHVSYCSWYK